jgi:hypothetical protein
MHIEIHRALRTGNEKLDLEWAEPVEKAVIVRQNSSAPVYRKWLMGI